MAKDPQHLDTAARSRAPAAGMNPGDEAPPGTPGTGENFCPVCHGDGRVDGVPCANCGGTGKIVQGIGGV